MLPPKNLSVNAQILSSAAYPQHSYTSQSYKFFFSSNSLPKDEQALSGKLQTTKCCSSLIITTIMVPLSAPHFIFSLFFLFSYFRSRIANILLEISADDLAFM